MESTRFRCLHGWFFRVFGMGDAGGNWGEHFWSNWGMIFGGKIGGCLFLLCGNFQCLLGVIS